MHFVLVCKDGEPKTNTSHELPPGLPPLRGIEHRIDLIPGAPLPNKAPYHVIPEETKEIQRQVEKLIDNGQVRES